MLLAPARVGGHDGVPARTCEDRLQAGMPRLADVDRVTGRHAAAARSPRALRAGEAGRAPARRRQESGPHTRGGGHRALGRGCGSARGAGAACLHVAVDDFSRVAYAELLPDERKGTCAAFMSRCLRFFEGMGVRVERVMTDNGPGYRSGEFNALLESEGARHLTRGPTAPGRTARSSA